MLEEIQGSKTAPTHTRLVMTPARFFLPLKVSIGLPLKDKGIGGIVVVTTRVQQVVWLVSHCPAFSVPWSY